MNKRDGEMETNNTIRCTKCGNKVYGNTEYTRCLGCLKKLVKKVKK